MRKNLCFLGLVMMILVLASCVPPSPVKTEYTLSITVEGQGTITPQSGTYNENTEVNLTAQAATGWVFAEWGGEHAEDLVQNGDQWKIVMNENKQLTAYFTEEENRVASPGFDPAPGEYNNWVQVSLYSATDGASIYYTTDETIPTQEGNMYVEPLYISQSTTIKAIALKEGLDDSEVVTGVYTINQSTTVWEPIFSLTEDSYVGAQFLTIISETPDTVIRYTLDGTNPTPNSGILYTGAINVDRDMTIKAIAYKDAYEFSTVVSREYSILYTLEVLNANPSYGTITVAPELEYYHYGTEITLTAVANEGYQFMEWSGAIYSLDSTYTFTLHESMVINGVFQVMQQCGKPYFQNMPGVYYNDLTVGLYVYPSDARIYYTTDGSEPSETNGTLYVDGILVTSETTIKAKAFREGFYPSETLTGIFTILYGIQLKLDGNGSFNLSPDPSDSLYDTYYYPTNTEVSVTAVADAKNVFDHWSGDVSGTDQTVQITLDTHKAITAHYKKLYTLIVNVNDTYKGSVLVEPDQDQYLEGTEVILTPVGNPGWKYSSFNGSVVDQNDGTFKYTFGGYSQDVVLTAFFAPITYSMLDPLCTSDANEFSMKSLAIDSNGDIYVTGIYTENYVSQGTMVKKYSPSGIQLDSFMIPNVDENALYDAGVEIIGDEMFVNLQNNQDDSLAKCSLDGTFLGYLVQIDPNEMNNADKYYWPISISSDEYGNLYISMTFSNRKYTADTGQLITSSTENLWGVLSVDKNHDLVYLVSNNYIHKTDLNFNLIESWTTNVTNVNGIGVDRNGHVYIASNNQLIYKYDSTGNLITMFNVGGYTSDLEIANDGTIYAAVGDKIQVIIPNDPLF